ncbi:MAG: FN3 domain-containing metallophosphoesterase family protein [Lachnospiraceae bacterium]|nr:FN3 domain-containing metallophosphoesterase family protein [Lachnospiraceae bacterium]
MKKKVLRITAGALSSAMLIGMCATGIPAKVTAATEHWNDASQEATDWNNWKKNWASYSSDYEHVSMTPGVDETQLNYAWYSHTAETPVVRIATKQNMDGAKEFNGTQTEAVTVGNVKYYSNKVTVTDLKENTRYYYQVFQNGKWQDAQTYTTKSFSSFSFLYVGDPQIGASKKQTSSENETMNSKADASAEDNLAARNDGYNWNKVLKEALEDHPDVSFMVSAGDQVNDGKNEREYAAYLGAEALTSLPVATTIGNHDSSSNQYTMHYNNPNTFKDTDVNYIQGKTEAGTDYYYTYGNVLFIVLDTNNYNCATHENVIKKAVEENKDAKWRIVMFHQDIYGSGYDHSDSDGMILRTQLTPLMDKYKIDVVLQGHDHTYSRTYQLEGDGKNHTAYGKDADLTSAEFLAQNNCYEIVSDTVDGKIVNPDGTVYLEANSATGSKFYNLIATQQDYISERSQTWTPSYSVVSVTNNSLSVTVYDTTTRQELKGSSTYTIVKEPQKQTITTAKSSYTKTVGAKAFKLSAKAKTKLTYTTSNKKVATVDKNGKVTIKGAGIATITIKAAATEKYKAATKKITIKVTGKK